MNFVCFRTNEQRLITFNTQIFFIFDGVKKMEKDEMLNRTPQRVRLMITKKLKKMQRNPDKYYFMK